jgi:hypothetical protein
MTEHTQELLVEKAKLIWLFLWRNLLLISINWLVTNSAAWTIVVSVGIAMYWGIMIRRAKINYRWEVGAEALMASPYNPRTTYRLDRAKLILLVLTWVVISSIIASRHY